MSFPIKPAGDEWFNVTRYETAKDAGYSTLNPLHNKEIGLLLEINREDKKYSFLTGITTGIASYGYEAYLGNQTDTSFGNIITQKVYDGDSRSLTLIQVPVYIKYPILLFTKNKTDSIDGKTYTYHHHSVLSLIAGISFNYAATKLINSPILYDSGRSSIPVILSCSKNTPVTVLRFNHKCWTNMGDLQ